MSTTATQVRERPILFSGAMIRAILDGRKCQTRRVVKPQPEAHPADRVCADLICWKGYEVPPAMLADRCPYGRPGDRLVVKEAAWMWCERRPNGTTATGRPKWLYVPLRSAPVRYAADIVAGARPAIRVVSPDTGNEWGWRLKVARFLPRWASRITLEITDVRVERVQEISEEDARAEGVTGRGGHPERGAFVGSGIRDAFAQLWENLNGPRGYGWNENPWVWCLTFRLAAAPQGAEREG